MSDSTQTAPKFDPAAAHQQRPKLRPIRGFGAKQGEQTLLGLADARQISDKVVFTAPQFQLVLPHMNGENDLDAIVKSVGRGLERSMLEGLVAQLDQAGLIEGPVFDSLLRRMRAEFDSSVNLPPASTVQMAEALAAADLGKEATDEAKREKAPESLTNAMDKWMKQALEPASDPSFDRLPAAIFAPHLDYWRGWMNYAHSYGRMRVVDRPDRIVILGTNHFGQSTGVCGCDKGFESPLGACEVDATIVEKLKKKLSPEEGDKLFAHRYDHEREHSIELQIPWIQHVFGPDESGKYPRVFGVLVHDPVVKGGESYDGEGLALQPFIEAMTSTLEEVGGKTLVISSADLSHVGASFGDQTPFIGDSVESKSFRDRVLKHDQAMLKLIEQASAEELMSAMAWQQNPTRWCSIGNIVATLKITGAKNVKLLNYTMAGDQQGVAAVSSFAGAIFHD